MKHIFFNIASLLILATISSSNLSLSAQEAVTPESSFNLPCGVTATTYSGNVSEQILEESETELTDDSFSFKVEWPTDGPEKLINNLRETIVEDLLLYADTWFSDEPCLSATNFPRISNDIVTSYIKQDKEAQMGYSRSFDISLISTDKTVTIKSESEQIFLNVPHFPYSLNISVYDVSSGDEIDYSIFPPIDKVRDLLINHLHNGKEKVNNPKDYNIEDIAKLPYPENLPIFEEEGLTFIWYVYEIAPRPSGTFTAKIPYSKFRPFASEELLKLFPNSGDEAANMKE